MKGPQSVDRGYPATDDISSRRGWAKWAAGLRFDDLPFRSAGRYGVGVVACVLILCTPDSAAAQRIVTWDLHSKYVTRAEALDGLAGPLAASGGPTGLRSWVVLPNGYTPTRCWPVLYLLHAAGPADEWVTEASVFRNLKAIIVLPGGVNSQYSNWWNAGARSPAWERWFFDELLPKVTKSFPVCSGRQSHAIAGASMGGFGALYLASQRPDYFGTAASFSGVIAITDPIIQFGFGGYEAVWGPPGGFYELGHDPASLVPNLMHTRVFVSVGDGTPLVPVSSTTKAQGSVGEAVMRHEASVFRAAALRAHVRVHFTEHGGIHTQDNWNLSLQDFLAEDPFGNPGGNVLSWSFATVSQSGSAWGYRFAFSQPPASVETFSYSSGTLRAAGTGQVSLVTPAGQRVRAKLPFVLRNGRLRGGRSGSPVQRRSSLPIVVTLRSAAIRRRAALDVTFRPRSLSRGRSYQLTSFQSGPKCTLSSVVRVAKWTAGRTARLQVRPGVGPGHPRNRWCRGIGSVNLSVVASKPGTTFEIGTLVGQAYFRAH